MFVRLKDDKPVVYVDLAMAYRAMGLYSRSDAVLQTYLEEFSDHPAIHIGLARSAMCQDKYELALSEIEKAFSLSPDLFGTHRTKAEIYLLKGDFIQAEEAYRKMLGSEVARDQRDGRDFLCNLYFAQGKFEKLKTEADELKKLGESYGYGGWVIFATSWKTHAEMEKGNIQQAWSV